MPPPERVSVFHVEAATQDLWRRVRLQFVGQASMAAICGAGAVFFAVVGHLVNPYLDGGALLFGTFCIAFVVIARGLSVGGSVAAIEVADAGITLRRVQGAPVFIDWWRPGFQFSVTIRPPAVAPSPAQGSRVPREAEVTIFASARRFGASIPAALELVARAARLGFDVDDQGPSRLGLLYLVVSRPAGTTP